VRRRGTLGLDLVTVGESMVQMNPLQTGPLRTVTLFEKHAAGAESNVAVGFRRMGHTSGWMSRVGDDEFGRYIIMNLRSEGVDVSRVKVDREAPTGVFFVQRFYPVPENSTVFYYRKGSAASRFSSEDVDPEYVRSAKIFHATGITPALSDSCREATWSALKTAEEAGVKISFDTNIRLKLWGPDRARETLLPMIKTVDYLFTDPGDAQILIGKSKPREICEAFMGMGPSLVAVKLGAEGAAAMRGGEYVEKPGYEVPVEDKIGAGDAFTATVLVSLLDGKPLDKAVEAGNVAGALVVTVRGDTEAIPSLEDIETFLKNPAKMR